MGTTIVTLKISKQVAASTEDCDTYIPANGATVYIKEFSGSAAFTQNSAVLLRWDHGGAGETELWTIKGEGTISGNKFSSITGDGVKKIGVCCDNGESGPVYMTGYALLKVVT